MDRQTLLKKAWRIKGVDPFKSRRDYVRLPELTRKRTSTKKKGGDVLEEKRDGGPGPRTQVIINASKRPTMPPKRGS